ncbi:MAG: two-component regulator propeller domain-containing protein, partial [Acidobacteriota bacterium]
MGLVIGARLLWSDESALRLEEISVGQGLSHSVVNTVFEDRDGFLWVGTDDGLNRYDGYDFTVWRRDLDSEDSLLSSRVRDIDQDENGRLWIATERGINILDIETGRISSWDSFVGADEPALRERVWSIMIDSHGTVWAGLDRSGVWWMGRGDAGFSAIRKPGGVGGNATGRCMSLLEGKDGGVWAAGSFGLIRVDQGRKEVSAVVEMPSAKNGLPTAPVDLFEDEDGTLWVGSSRLGLVRVDGEPLRATQVFDWELLDQHAGLEHVRAVTKDRQGNVWIGTVEGVHLLTAWALERSGEGNRVESPVRMAEGLAVVSALESRSGILWLGTRGRGLLKVNPVAMRFRNLSHREGDRNSIASEIVWGIHQSRDGALWVGTSEGLDRVDPSGDQVQHFHHDPDFPDTMSPGSVSVVMEDSDGFIWVGTPWQGLKRLDRTTGRFRHFRPSREDPSDIASSWVGALLEDRKGRLWVGTSDGLDSLDRETGSF